MCWWGLFLNSFYRSSVSSLNKCNNNYWFDYLWEILMSFYEKAVMILSLICLYMKLAVNIFKIHCPGFNSCVSEQTSWGVVPENRTHFACCEAVVLQDRTLALCYRCQLSFSASQLRILCQSLSHSLRATLWGTTELAESCGNFIGGWRRVEFPGPSLFAPSYCLPFTKEFLHFKIILIFFAKSQANFSFL